MRKHETRNAPKAEAVTGFKSNAWYESLLKKRDKGRQDITLLSSNTQHALAIYEEQKRRHEAAKRFDGAAVYSEVTGSAKVKGEAKA